jgi:hypothetical protein
MPSASSACEYARMHSHVQKKPSSRNSRRSALYATGSRFASTCAMQSAQCQQFRDAQTVAYAGRCSTGAGRAMTAGAAGSLGCVGVTGVAASDESASPTGQLKDALVPAAFTAPAAPEPASVLTAPEGETMRMRLLPQSATSTMPLGWSTTPAGPLKAAAVPLPSAKAAAPPPARVDTAPVASETMRTALPLLSATTTEPDPGADKLTASAAGAARPAPAASAPPTTVSALAPLAP